MFCSVWKHLGDQAGPTSTWSSAAPSTPAGQTLQWDRAELPFSEPSEGKSQIPFIIPSSLPHQESLFPLFEVQDSPQLSRHSQALLPQLPPSSPESAPS